jgi:hypothetical protein
MAESDTLINSLNQRIATLERDLAQTRAESRNRKIQGRTQAETLAGVTKERDDLAASVVALTTERDQARAQLTAAPGELQLKITELTDQIRTRDHKARFTVLAKEAGCDPEAIDAAWDLAGYKPDADEPDDARITESITRVQSRLPMAFRPAQTGQANGAAAPKKAPLAAGLGSDRGSPGTASNKLRVTKSQMRDHSFMKANQKAISEAAAAGSFEIIDG